MSKSFRSIPSTLMITLGLLSVLIFPLGQPTFAISAYNSGYDHGCSDAHSGGHPYLDNPGKGPSFHTGTFMQGYDAGYSACSSGQAPTCSDGSNPDSNGNCPSISSLSQPSGHTSLGDKV